MPRGRDVTRPGPPRPTPPGGNGGTPEPPGRPGPLGGVWAVLTAFAAGTLLAGLLVALSGATTDGSVYNVLSFAGLWGGFVGVPVFLSRTRGTGRLATDVGLRFGGPADIGLGVAGGIVGYLVAEIYSTSIQALGDHADLGHEATRLSGHGLGIGFVLFAVLATVGAPIAEEIFFRGLTQPVAQRYLGGVGGLLMTSALFGFAHLGSNPIEAVVPLAVFGAILGLLAWRTGRLGPGIIAHMTFNGITVLLLAASR